MTSGDTPWSDVVHERFHSSDPGEVEQHLRLNYVDLHIEVTGADTPFCYELDTVADPLTSIARARNTRTIVAHTAPLDEMLLVHRCRRGALGWDGSPYGEVRTGPGDVVLVPPGCASTGTADEVDTDLVGLDAVTVADHAAHTCGIDPADLRFTGLSPLSSALQRHWLGVVAHVRDDVLGAEPTINGNGILRDGAFRSLATALLATFPNTALAAAQDDRSSPRRAVPDAVLTRVTDHLREHAAEPVGPADVAAVAGVPYRDVASALRRRNRADPGSALWEARLDGVRRDLVEADRDGEVTVARTAARWGFGHVGAFRAAYARTFGESPERTLWR